MAQFDITHVSSRFLLGISILEAARPDDLLAQAEKDRTARQLDVLLFSSGGEARIERLYEICRIFPTFNCRFSRCIYRARPRPSAHRTNPAERQLLNWQLIHSIGSEMSPFFCDGTFHERDENHQDDGKNCQYTKHIEVSQGQYLLVSQICQ